MSFFLEFHSEGGKFHPVVQFFPWVFGLSLCLSFSFFCGRCCSVKKSLFNYFEASWHEIFDFELQSIFTLKTTSSEVTSNSSSETRADSFSKLSPRNSSLWTTWTKNFLMNFWHDVTRRKHPRDSAKDSVSRTFSELSLGISRSGRDCIIFCCFRSKKIMTLHWTLLYSVPPSCHVKGFLRSWGCPLLNSHDSYIASGTIQK